MIFVLLLQIENLECSSLFFFLILNFFIFFLFLIISFVSGIKDPDSGVSGFKVGTPSRKQPGSGDESKMQKESTAPSSFLLLRRFSS